MKRISLFFLTLLLTACSVTQPAAPTPTPLPTFTPAPTSTSTPIPSATPTSGPAYPASLSPEDQDWLRAHADDPNVHWTVDADGVTTVEMHQPLNMTEDEEKAAINAECLGNCYLDRGEGKNLFTLLGVYTGNIETIIQPNGSTEVVTSMNILVKEEIRTVTMRWILDVRNPANAWLYNRLGIKGDRVTLAEIESLFAVGNSASPGFIYKGEPPSPFKDTAFYLKYFAGRYDSNDWAAAQRWVESGFDPELAIELPVFGD
jgi:hypothetical protein